MIRPKLSADRGTWGRALGELLLIIVGVLIALAVDDWRTERAAERAARGYLVRIVEDVRVDLASFQMGVEAGERMEVAANKVLDVYEGFDPDLDESDEYVAAILKTSFTGDRTRVAHRDTYDDLISTGNLALLPVEIQDVLAAYYAEKDRYRRRQDGFDQQLRVSWYPLPAAVLGPHILPELWLQLSNPEGTGSDRTADLDLSQADFDAVVERLRTEPLVWKGLAHVKHFAAQKREIYGKRLPSFAEELLSTLESAGVDVSPTIE